MSIKNWSKSPLTNFVKCDLELNRSCAGPKFGANSQKRTQGRSIMLSNIFSGLGGLTAPPPGTLLELGALIKGMQHTKALELLESLAVQAEEVDKNVQYDGVNALHLACMTGALEIVVELIALGCDTNSVSSHVSVTGNRPLHFAALGGHKRVVVVLLRAGADPSQPNNEGKIPTIWLR